MDNEIQDLSKAISDDKGQEDKQKGIVLIKNQENASEDEDDLLNLIAEIVVENIVKKLRNGRHRIHQDQ